MKDIWEQINDILGNDKPHSYEQLKKELSNDSFGYNMNMIIDYIVSLEKQVKNYQDMHQILIKQRNSARKRLKKARQIIQSMKEVNNER